MESISSLIITVFLENLMIFKKIDLHLQHFSLEDIRAKYLSLLSQNHPYAIYFLSVFYFLEEEENLLDLESCYITSKGLVDKDIQIHILEMLARKDKSSDLSLFITEEVKLFKKNTNYDLTFFYNQFDIYDNEFDYLKGKEAKLVECLLSGIGDKYDLIESIYGEQSDLLKAEKSFKVLLSRVRKKIHCDLILNTDGLYQILN